MPARLSAARMPLEQQAMRLHHPINPLVVGWSPALLMRSARQSGLHPPIAVGGHGGDHGLDLLDQGGLRQGRPATRRGGLRLCLLDEIRARHPEGLGDDTHREPSFGNETDRSSRFFESTTSKASLNTSASSVFLPKSRCNSRTWFWRAR